MKPLEPPEISGASYDEFLADLERQKEDIDRKTRFLGMGSFLLIFALLMPREAWQGTELGATLILLVGTLLAQYCAYRGLFDRITRRLFGRPYGLTFYILILACILCVRAVYGLVVHLLS